MGPLNYTPETNCRYQIIHSNEMDRILPPQLRKSVHKGDREIPRYVVWSFSRVRF